MVLFLLLVSVGLTRAENDAGIRVVGTWQPSLVPEGTSLDTHADNSYVFAEPGSRRLFVLGTGTLAAYDADTLRPVGTAARMEYADTAIVPEAGGSLFFAWKGTAGATDTRIGIDRYSSGPSGVVRTGRVDLTEAMRRQIADSQSPPLRIIGLYRHPAAPVLWLLLDRVDQPDIPTPRFVTVAEVSLHALEGGPAEFTWTKRPDGCFQSVHFHNRVNAGLGYVPETNSLYFGCSNQAYSTFQTLPVPRGVGRLKLQGDPFGAGTQPQEFELFPWTGDFTKGDSFFDPVSRRLVINAYNPSANSTTAYVFDTVRAAFVGGVSLCAMEVQQVGLDIASGRLYGACSAGFVYADIRTTPVSQGGIEPELRAWKGQGALEAVLSPDSVTRRVYVKYRSAGELVVVEDGVPAYVPQDDPNPDANTRDIDEVPGITDRTLSASAQGFGARFRLIGGIEGIKVNATGTNVQGVVPVGEGTREFRASFLHTAQIANDEAVAAAIAADRDLPNTQGDIDKVRNAPGALRTDVEGRIPPEERHRFEEDERGKAVSEGTGNGLTEADRRWKAASEWPYQEARCGDFGDAPLERSANGALSTCNAATPVASARAHFDGVDSGGVAVARTALASRVIRDDSRGSHAAVESSAFGVSVLGDLLQIGEVSVTAEAWAKGRPGTAGHVYSRVIRDVRVRGTSICTDHCDPHQMAAAINSRLVGRVHVAFPSPDPDLAKGTPRGYQALVRRSPGEHLQEVILNEQPADRVEVPGMTISLMADDAKASRLLVDLAAVAVEARYGISLIGEKTAETRLPDIPTQFTAGDGSGGPLGPIAGLDPAIVNKVDLKNSSDNPEYGGLLGKARRLALLGAGLVVKLFPIWALLLAPVYVAARRSLLLHRGYVEGLAK